MARPKKLPSGMIKRGKSYYARFMRDGERIVKSLSSDFDVACEALNDLRARSDRADLGLIDNSYSWDELKAQFIRWAKQAVRNPGDYERDLRKLESYCRVKNVRQVDHKYVFGYREWRLSQVKAVPGNKSGVATSGQTVSPRTVNREVGTLHLMLNKACEWKLIGSNPIEGIAPLEHTEPRKQRRALSVQEVEAIFQHAPAHLLPVLRLIASTGIRRNELVELRFSDIDLEGRTITIRASVAKGKRARQIPLDDASVAILAKQKADAATREELPTTPLGKFSRDHVFVTQANTPWRNNLLRAFYSVCRKAGINDAGAGGAVDIHGLRVTFTTLTLEGGANPKAVQAILGHSTLSLTMNTYAKVTERDKREAVGVLPFAKVTPPSHVVSFPNKGAAMATDLATGIAK